MVLTWLDALPDDFNMVFAVRAGVLVPEANHMAQFVHHNTKLVAVFADGDGLGTISPLAHETATTVTGEVASVTLFR